MPLSDTTIRAAKADGKTRRLSDERGLYLEISPNGGKWWRLKYRIDGKEKRLSLGVYPDVGLKEARERRDEARGRVAKGIDPSAHRKSMKRTAASRAENTFEAVAREWFEKFSPQWAPTHSGRIMRRLERDVFPRVGGQPLDAITAPELLEVIRRIEVRALETAHRVLRSCGQVFRYGIATGRCTRDPSQDLRGALPPKISNHFAATTEPKRLGSILRQLDAYPGTPVVQAALRLAPLLFVRPGELRSAKWEDIDLEDAEWSFTTSKTKTPHIVPLCRQALQVLRELHLLTGQGKNPLTGHGKYVFPGARSSLRPMSDNAVLVALRAMEIGADEMTGHGFRAVARTILDEVLSFRPDIIELQLAHAVRDPNGRAYNRTTHLAERRRMMQVWADHLDDLKVASGILARGGGNKTRSDANQ
jgi:integrase